MQKVFRRLGLIAMALAAGVVVSPAAGIAAPQALALVATKGKTVLNCSGSECSAEFSAFCLQADRTSPTRGTAYHLVGDGAIKVTGITDAGDTVDLDTSAVLRFHSLRTHVAVRISVPQETLRRRGLKGVSVVIGDNVTLAPAAVASDGNPQDKVGLAAAAGPLRGVGTRIVDSNSGRMAAARLTSRMINDLEANPAPPTNVTQTLWTRTVGDSPNASADAQRMARGALELCQFAVEQRGIGEIKGCLQQHHDKFVDFLNGHYWKAVGTGS